MDIKELAKKEKPEGYVEIFSDIVYLLDKARSQAYKAVDNIRVQTYWQIGERVVRGELQHKDRADYGEKLVENLAEDLSFDRRLLYRIVRFYRAYPIVATVSPQLSWSHYEALITLQDNEIRRFYENQLIQNRWSIRELRKQIKSKLFERTKTEKHVVFPKTTELIRPEDIFKEIYHFDFLELKKNYSEDDVKNQLLLKFERTLKELGFGFFVGEKEKKLIIDGIIHNIDLVLFNKSLRCSILVDFKIGKFRSEHVGQMNKYVNYYRKNEQLDWEREAIGLILCEDKGIEEVHYALAGIDEKIFVKEYKVYLPSEEEIKKKLMQNK
ncbi:MAG: PDDEXK nuclease domain-containing protein [Nanoarchaeota archaeon]|nr:DUF1016 family protein [Nanoarchaeota archaeon]MBU1632435.1 DUF1016 family protein [Nanoarchaeota archaeon]MBU1875606.1 DUF1016 family protein [Nanoarchaeota archaeon]